MGGVFAFSYLAGVHNASDGKRILWCSEPHSINSRDTAGKSHSSPSIDAVLLFDSTVFRIAKIDDEIDSDELLDAEREEQIQKRNHDHALEWEETSWNVAETNGSFIKGVNERQGRSTTDLHPLREMDSGRRDARFCVLEVKAQAQCGVASDNKRMGIR